MTPFDFWAGAWRNARDMMQTGLRFADMMGASKAVIDSRSRTIQDAMQNPLAADHAELARMIPEKVEAFSLAGASAYRDIFAWQMEAFAQWQQIVGMMIAGKPPSLAQYEGLFARSSRMTTKAASAGGKALSPIHKRATANAKRLKAR